MKTSAINQLLKLEKAVHIKGDDKSHLLEIHNNIKLIVQNCLDQHLASEDMQKELEELLKRHQQTTDVDQLRNDLLYAIHLCLNALDYRVE